MAKILKIKTELKVFENGSDLGKQEYKLFQEAKKVTSQAYAPYSNFYVGAAILLKDDTIFTGTNQENIAYPSGLCAERVAIFAVGANYPDKVIKMIAIAARKNLPAGLEKGIKRIEEISDKFLYVTPCGACRQVMLEYEIKQESLIKIIMSGENDRVYISESVKMLLPFHFKFEK